MYLLIHWKEYSVASVVFLIKTCNLNLIMRKQINTKSETFYKISGHRILQNCQGHKKKKSQQNLQKTEELSQIRGEGVTIKCNTVSWIGSWTGKKDLMRKSGEF